MQTGGFEHIDLSGMIASVGDEEDFLTEILGLICDDIESRSALLKSYLEAGSLGEVRREAHTIKGHALNVGAVALAEIARAIEHAAKGENRVYCQMNIDALDRTCELVRTDLRRCLGRK